MPKNNGKNLQTIFMALSMLVIGATLALVGMEISQNTTAGVVVAVNDNEAAPSAVTIVDVDADDDAYMGEDDAPILMIEFSDFQCPFCRKFYNETLAQIKENYIDTGLVKFVYRDLPLVSLGHTGAIPAANAAACAREQKGDEMFFAFHNKIFDGQNLLGNGTVSIPDESLYQYAEELGLDMDAFSSCQENLDYEDEINADAEVAKSIGINGTPGFVINGQIVTGAYPYSTFESVFEELLQ